MSAACAERRLILLSASVASRRRARLAQARWPADAAGWSRLEQTLRARKLLPTLGPRIVELAEGRASAEFAAGVEQACVAARRQSAFIHLVSLRVLGMLAEAGIPATPLKGPQLSETLYGEHGRRLSGDIDLLVSPERLRAAVDVVCELGYEQPADPVDERGLPLLHFALAHERGELPPVELHWRVHWYEERFARERLLPPSANVARDWRPEPCDELAALLLFYARDGFVDLRAATDLSAWWDAFGERLGPAGLGGLMRSHPELSPALRAAAHAAENVVGLPAARVIGGRTPRLRERAAIRLANPNPLIHERQLYAEMGLIDGLLAPAGGLPAFLRRQVFPPRAVLDQHARHGQRARRRSSLARAVGVLGRYCIATVRIVRPPETSI